MKISVVSKISEGKPTMGEMFIDGQHFCYTLEPEYRGDVGADPSLKVWGQTAIPRGTYLVDVRFSNHFQRDLVHVENGPQFSEIMCHGGNTSKDTEGCTLCGANTNWTDTVSNCSSIVDKLVELVSAECDPVYITYSIADATT